MQTLKVIGLGVLFSFVAFEICVFISILRGGLHVEAGTAHATGLSAVMAAW